MSAAAAAALFGIPEYSAGDALEVLVDAHLLESVGTDRYRFHDLLRVYAAERAADDRRAAPRWPRSAACSAWYMRAADAAATAVSPHRYDIALEPAAAEPAPPAFGTAEDALAWYDSERANLVAATRQAAAAGLHAIAWRLPASLFSVFSRRGNWADCIATNRIALDSARAAGRPPRRGLGAEQPRRGPRPHRDPEGSPCSRNRWLSGARSVTGRARPRRPTTSPTPTTTSGRTDEALGLYRRALELNREVGYQYGEGVALVNLGWILLDLDRAGEALDYLQQAQRIFAEMDYPRRSRATPSTSWAGATCRWGGTPKPWTTWGRPWPATRSPATGAGRRPP